MNDFKVTVELDSPVLLSGAASGKADPARLIRPASVRGLMHTFARALFGPLLHSDPAATRHAERRLLGAQGGSEDDHHHEYGATFRVEVVPFQLEVQERIPNCPHDSRKGKRSGFGEGQTATLVVRPRPHAVRSDPDLPAMLWTVLWTGLAFGALGNRSRRGYGSITVTGMDGVDGGAAPRIDGLLNGAETGIARALPTWPTLPSDGAALAADLCHGLQSARAAARSWLSATGRPAAPRGMPPFFQLFGPDWVYVGRAFPSSNDAMARLMRACSDALHHHDGRLYRRTLGAGGGHRLASPLWVRLYRTEEGWVPVATFSGDPGQRTLVDQVLSAIGARVNGNLQTLKAAAGGGC